MTVPKTRHPMWGTWHSMMNRCYRTANPDYGRYGGRGITVCDQWHNFWRFAEDIERILGPRPPGKTLDRIRNLEGYDPGNVRWATAAEQAHNRRKPVLRTRSPWRVLGADEIMADPGWAVPVDAVPAPDWRRMSGVSCIIQTHSGIVRVTTRRPSWTT